MEILFDGVKEFNKKDYEENKLLFRKLSRKQEPHTLFIGCSDSRIVPQLITKTMPGDLFVVRNIANIVPLYRASSEYLSTTSAIEYAVMVLNVNNIIVCGHSDCGGCKALSMSEDAMKNIPHTNRWLELAGNARTRAEETAKNVNAGKDIEWLVEQENIVEQMNHLVTYPFIKERYRNGKINIYGWYYHIESGKVYNYDKETKTFILIE